MSCLRGTLTITEGGSTADTPARSLGRQRAADRQAAQGGGFRGQYGEAGLPQLGGRPARARSGHGEGPAPRKAPPPPPRRRTCAGDGGAPSSVCAPACPLPSVAARSSAALVTPDRRALHAARSGGQHRPPRTLPAFLKTVRRCKCKQFKHRKAFLLFQHSKDAEVSKVEGPALPAAPSPASVPPKFNALILGVAPTGQCSLAAPSSCPSRVQSRENCSFSSLVI